MSQIHAGEVVIDLDGQERVLRPSLRAADLINTHFGSFNAAVTQIQAMNLSAYTVVIRHGLGIKSADATGLAEKVWASGTIKLMVPLTEYLMILANGGKPLADPVEGDDAPGKGES